VDLGAVNRRMIESLIGGRDGFDWRARAARSSRPSKARWKAGSGRSAIARAAGGLFGEIVARSRTVRALPNVPDWPDKEKLAGEKEMLGSG
jgi:DNA polymerase III alpha subunit